MANHQNLFEQFTATSYEQWLEKVKKDLKGRALDDLHWEIEDGVRLAPFYNPNEVVNSVLPIERSTNNWEIGGIVAHTTLTEANKEALESLRGGIEALQFQLDKPVLAADLERLLAQVETDYISVHFNLKGLPVIEFVDQLIIFLKQGGKALTSFKGSLCFDPFEQVNGLETCAALLKKYGEQFDQFKLIQLQDIEETGISDNLAHLLAKGTELLVQLEEQAVPKALVAKHLKLKLNIGTRFFLDLSKLRAIRLLWANLYEAFEIADSQQPTLSVGFASFSMQENPNQNMIQASTQALAAVIGGAEILFIPPASDKEKIAFHNRIARNIQHLLKMESFMDRVVDPAAGSHYIETVTQKLTELAWEKFKAIEQKGGFLSTKK